MAREVISDDPPRSHRPAAPRDGAGGAFSGATGRWPWIALAAALLAVPPALAEPVGLRFATENDVLTHNPTDDDHYTFAVAFEVDRAPYRFTVRENAFTDRTAGVRFDETSLSVGRSLPLRAPWRVRLETGLVRVGRGILGQDAQNAIHRLIGDDEVDLRYHEPSLHLRLGVEAERILATARRVSIRARFDAVAAPGLRADAVAGAEATWQPGRRIAVRVLAGLRYAHASLAPLESHVVRRAPAARVEVMLRDRVFLSWTYNDYGDKREHLSLGFRTAPG
jgi:hypothetical protein